MKLDRVTVPVPQSAANDNADPGGPATQQKRAA